MSDAVVSSGDAAVFCGDTDEGHTFGPWEAEYYYQDLILRRCTVCGRSEHALSMVPTEQLTGCTVSEEIIAMAEKMPVATYDNLPQWYGVSFHSMGDTEGAPRVTGFATRRESVERMAEFGFNFTRVCLDARRFFSNASMEEANLNAFIELDSLISMCVENGIHCSLNLHYDFGRDYYDSSKDTTFKDEAMQDAFVRFWEFLAERYKNISSNALDFDLMNEPREYRSDKQYIDLMNRTIDAVRAISPDRLIVVEMSGYSTTPVPQFAGRQVVEAFHYYVPGSEENSTTEWTPESVYDFIKGFKDFGDKYGMQVILNECGAAFETPADDAAAWFDATFAACKELGISWNVHDYFGYFGFATADKYCIRSDTQYVCRYDEGKPIYVYPDILEAFQKNMDQSLITLTADDLRNGGLGITSLYALDMVPSLEASGGKSYALKEWEEIIVTEESCGFERTLCCEISEVPADAEIVRFNLVLSVVNPGSGTKAPVRPSVQITDVRVLTEDGRSIVVDGLAGCYDSFNNGQELTVEFDDHGLSGEELSRAKIVVSVKLLDF